MNMEIECFTLPKWELSEAINLIRELQKHAWSCNLHLALAGSVLNEGTSDNDLDIIVLGQNNGKEHDHYEFMRILENLFSEFNSVLGGGYSIPDIERQLYRAFTKDGKKMDFFMYDLKDYK
jgi:hypothetical protein